MTSKPLKPADQDHEIKGTVKRLLTWDEMNEIADVFKLPFNNFEIILKHVDTEVRRLTLKYLQDVEIYDGMLQEYKQHLLNKFLSSLIEAGTPIGAITSDAIGQQATQALLNTFHSVGTIKSGGPDGIKENISISAKRKVIYSIIHMKNGKMSFADVMNMKSKFIGLPISKLLISKPESMIINIRDELAANPFLQSLTDVDRKRIFASKSSWWYSLSPFEGVFDPSIQNQPKRTCLRLKFDVQKLYEYKLLTSTIATFINKFKFQFTIPKRAGNSSKRETEDEFVFAVPSPTHIGIVDIFMKSQSDNKDHLLISLIHGDEFKNLILSGIEGIINFYAVSTPVIRLIKNVNESSRFDKDKGMWIELADNRFTGIPFFRILELLDKSGLEYHIPYYNRPNSYNEKYTDLPFEFVSHKLMPELRSSMKLRAYLFGGMTEHAHPSFEMMTFQNGMMQSSRIMAEIDHYSYSKIGDGFDVALYHIPRIENFSGPISNKKFKNKTELTRYINKLDQRITYGKFNEIFDIKDKKDQDSFSNFFKVPSTYFKTVAFEIEDEVDKYMTFYMFQLKYIDYNIDVNLDYVNSQFVTQSLESVLSSQFWIPYDTANQGGISLPDSIRKFKTFDVVKVEQPERRILLKSKMFLTDKYDYLGRPNRELTLEYFRKVRNDMSKLKKEELIDELTVKYKASLSTDDIKSLIDGKASDPLDRLIMFIKQRTSENDNNYVYAETSGTNFISLITHPLVFGPKTVCNHFRQVHDAFGLEPLRNTLNYDLITMINSSGYIAVEYMNFLTNVTTHNGINPMTSEGISCQSRDYLAMASFDNAPKYVLGAALLGKEHSTTSTSTCIFLGKNPKLGTGYVIVGVDKTKLNVLSRKEGISEGFLQILTRTSKSVGNLSITDDTEESIYIPKLEAGKFPRVPWLMNNFIKKDIIYFIQQGIDDSKNEKLKFFSPLSLDTVKDVDDIFFKFKVGSSKRPE